MDVSTQREMNEIRGDGKGSRRRPRRHRLGGLAVAAILALTGACSPMVDQHGHRFTERDLERIEPGVSSREEVARILGSPSTLATFEDDRWYYITQRTERMSFYQKELTDQDVVTIEFDDRGVVERVDRHGLEQAMAITPSSDETRTLGNELSLVEQLIGNIGRFNTEEGTPGRGPGQ